MIQGKPSILITDYSFTINGNSLHTLYLSLYYINLHTCNKKTTITSGLKSINTSNKAILRPQHKIVNYVTGTNLQRHYYKICI